MLDATSAVTNMPSTPSVTVFPNASAAGSSFSTRFSQFEVALRTAYEKEPVELLPADAKFANPTLLRDFVFSKIDEVVAGMGPDEIKVLSVGGNRFVVGSGLHGIADVKILANRAIDAYIAGI